MNAFTLLAIAGGGTFAVLWILCQYVPLVSRNKFPGKKKYWSPRLFISNKLLGLFDSTITIVMVFGSWIGVTAIMGIGMIVFNVATAIGISLGVYTIRKFLAPRWGRQYTKEVKRLESLTE